MSVMDEGGSIRQYAVSLPKSSGSSLDAKQPYRQVIIHEIGVALVISAIACSFSRNCTHKIMFFLLLKIYWDVAQ